jgi:hypothetical protein
MDTHAHTDVVKEMPSPPESFAPLPSWGHHCRGEAEEAYTLLDDLRIATEALDGMPEMQAMACP